MPSISAKNLALKKMNYRGTLRYMLPWMTAELDEIDKVFGGDPWPYGVEPNRPTLEALVRYLEEQGVIAKAPRVDDLFVPVGTRHYTRHDPLQGTRSARSRPCAGVSGSTG